MQESANTPWETVPAAGFAYEPLPGEGSGAATERKPQIHFAT